MKLVKKASILVVLFCAPLLFSETKNKNGYEITLKAERENAVYKAGEDAVFILSVKKDGKPVSGMKLSGNISKDSVAPRTNFEGKTDSGGKFKVKGTLGEPGFLKCQIFVFVPPKGENDKKAVEMLAGAGFSPFEIKPSMPAPDDFDEFWNKQKEILKSIPMNAKFTPVKVSNPNIEAFDVQADTFNGKVSAYLVMPKNAKKASLPAILLPQGAGVYSSSLAFNWANKGFMALSFNVHGIPNGRNAEFYKNLEKNELRGYAKKNSKSRETIFFRTAYMRVMRAMDVVMAQPQWDGKNLVMYGGSQGAGQAIAGAGLYNDKVTLVVAKYPALCDHTGIVIGRTTGWPHFAKEKDANGNYDKESVEAARYIDAVNFAERIKCPAIFTIHYADDVCEPTSSFAAYNNIKTQKKLVPVVEARHPAPEWENELMFKNICERVEASGKN